MLIRLVFALMSGLLCISCTQSYELTASEQSSIIDSVNSMLNNYYEDIRQEGLLAEFNYLDSSDQFFWVPPGFNSPVSYDSVASILRTNAPMFKSVSNVLETSRVIPLTKDLANYTITLRSVVTDTLGNVSDFKLIETGIVIKRKNGWKLLSGQTSLIAKSQ